VERADGVFLSEMDILEELEALEAFEFAEVGAIGAFEAEVVALEEGGLFLRLGMAEGVGAVDGFHHEVFEFEAALHVPGGVDEALDGEVLEEADGLEGVEEVFAEGFVFGAVGFGDDRVEVGETMTHGIARRRGLACGLWVQVDSAWGNPFRKMKKDQCVSPLCGGRHTGPLCLGEYHGWLSDVKRKRCC
jgi:hypothetical protein